MRLRPPALSLLTWLALAAHASAQTPAAPVPAAADTPDFVVERVVSRVAFDAQGTKTSDVSLSIRVNTPAGVQQAGTVTIPFRQGAATLQVTHVRVRRPDGSVIETPLTPVFDLPAPITQAAPTYSDVYLRHINVQALQPGDVLEYAWETVEPSLIPGQFWFSDDVDGEPFGGRRVLEVSWPSAADPTVKSGAHMPQVTTADGRTTYRWTSPETAPGADDVDDSDIPDVQITSFDAWTDVGAAIRDLWRGRAEVTPEIRARAGELTAGLSTDEQKARAIYRFVAANIRYVAVAVGIGRIQPNAAATVLANGFGDCKDKHILLEALLRAVGIEAVPVLIGPGVDLDADVPSIDRFSHVISLIETGTPAPVWLDTTLEVAPFGFLIATERDATALALPAAGDARLITTPATAVRANAFRTETEGRVSEDGHLQAVVREVVSGDFEVLLRTAFRAAGRANWEKLVQSFPLPRTRGGVVSDIVVSPPEETEAPFRVEYRYRLDAVADWPRGTLNPPTVIDVESFRIPDGVTLELGPATEFTAVARLELPDTIEVREDSSPAVDIDHDFGRYSFRWSTQGRVVETERQFEAGVSRLASSEGARFREFLDAVRDAPYRLRVRRVTPWAWTDRLTIDWYENASAATSQAIRAATDISERGDHQEAMAALRRVLDDEPESDAAWQVLAWVQYSSGSTDRAIDTMRRRMPDVKGPSLIKYYVSCVSVLGRRDDAIAALSLGHERFPADREFPLYLAEALVAAGRTAEAIDLLSPQADRQGASARYHFTRAEAYLGQGRRTDAVEALRRSAEVDGSADNLNRVAWTLVERDLALDEALTLSERSVRAAGAQAGGFQVETAGVVELRAVSLLPSYWDTLGWIHFKRGDRLMAERYLEAAWQVSHEAPIARHLAAVYTADGQEAAAARYLEYSIVADPGVSSLAFGAAGATRARALTDARNAMDRLRTFDLPALGVGAPVDVLLLVGADGRVLRPRRLGAGAADTRLLEALRAVTVPWRSPDSGVTQIIRRGRVSCPPQGGACTLVLQSTATAAVGLPQ